LSGLLLIYLIWTPLRLLKCNVAQTRRIAASVPNNVKRHFCPGFRLRCISPHRHRDCVFLYKCGLCGFALNPGQLGREHLSRACGMQMVGTPRCGVRLSQRDDPTSPAPRKQEEPFPPNTPLKPQFLAFLGNARLVCAASDFSSFHSMRSR
jgi:hypothetical protein